MKEKKESNEVAFDTNVSFLNTINQDLVARTLERIDCREQTHASWSFRFAFLKPVLYIFHFCDLNLGCGFSLIVVSKTTNSQLYCRETDDWYLDRENILQLLDVLSTYRTSNYTIPKRTKFSFDDKS